MKYAGILKDLSDEEIEMFLEAAKRRIKRIGCQSKD